MEGNKSTTKYTGLQKVLATSLGAGYIPKAPGTFGALFGAFVSILVMWYMPQSANEFHAIGATLSYFIGVWCANGLKEEWGDDPSKIVIDETCGLWISLLFIPITYINIILAFILFRFFDILKPLGIKKIDNIKNGHAVMLDDVLAGVYSNMVLHGILYVMISYNLG